MPHNKEDLLKVRISEALKDEAKEFAEKKGESLSNVVREALRQYILSQRELNIPGMRKGEADNDRDNSN